MKKIISLLSLIAIPIITLAIGTTLEGHRHPNTGMAGEKKYTEHGICKEVSNSRANDIFIPTKTADEWNKFIAAAGNTTTTGIQDLQADVCCYAHDDIKCYGGDLWWYDSCGIREDKQLDCGTVSCANDECCYENEYTDCHLGNVWNFSACDTPRTIADDCEGAGCVGGFCIDVNCGGTWDSNAGNCSVSCGNGKYDKEYIITVQPKNNGIPCPNPLIIDNGGNDCYAGPCLPYDIYTNIWPTTVDLNETIHYVFTSKNTDYYQYALKPQSSTIWSSWISAGTSECPPTNGCTNTAQISQNAGNWSFKLNACNSYGCVESNSHALTVIEPCSPIACGTKCGTVDSGCGYNINCGGCDTGKMCKNNQCCYSAGACTILGVQCGVHDDLCGGTIDCGGCGFGTYCNGSNCCYTEQSCIDFGITSGIHGNLCGGFVDCN